MIKVKHTKIWNTIPVAEAKLVLSPIERGRIMRFKPILISETEMIEVGDWYVNGNTKATNHKIAQCLNQEEADNLNKIKELMSVPNFPKQVITAKILALPEHFSDGKLKDGDKVLVECEKYYYSKKSKVGGHDHNYFSYQIKLNPHIALHPVEEKK